MTAKQEIKSLSREELVARLGDLAEPAYRFIGLLDGKRTVNESWKIANETTGDDAPTQGEVIQLLGQLYTGNLLQADVPADTQTLFSRYKKRKQREIERKKTVIEAQITALNAQFEAEREELGLLIAKEQQRDATLAAEILTLARSRQADELPGG